MRIATASKKSQNMDKSDLADLGLNDTGGGGQLWELLGAVYAARRPQLAMV